jgi:hypothetical protein
MLRTGDSSIAASGMNNIVPKPAEVLPVLINDASIVRVLRGALEDVESEVSSGVLEREGVQRAINQAATIVASQAYVRFGELLPGLVTVGGELLERRVFPARVYNALAREDVHTWSEFARMRPLDLLDIRTLGTIYLHAAAAAALRRVLALALELVGSSSPPHARQERAAVPSSDDGQAAAGYLALPIQALAQWAVLERSATRMGDILCLVPDLGRMPADLRAVWDQASQLTLAELLGPQRVPRLAELTTRLLCEFDERDRLILNERVLSATPTTLASLGARLGISSGRVQQLHTRIVAKLHFFVQTAQFAPLRWRAEELADKLGPMLHAESPMLADGLNWATHDFPQELKEQGERLLLWLAELYRRHDGWTVPTGTNP